MILINPRPLWLAYTFTRYDTRFKLLFPITNSFAIFNFVVFEPNGCIFRKQKILLI